MWSRLRSRRFRREFAVIALLDGNNYYVSAETVFRPSLAGLPVVVLSNNDGCVISRSNAARDLGIKMGAPWFKIAHLQDSDGVVALSANFPLYADISDRMMSLAAGLGPTQEIYSIDECFIGLDGVPGDLVDRARRVRARILQWVGIPCCVGIGPTKTLAKLANFVAKSADRKPGSYPVELAQVCHLGVMPPNQLVELMTATEVGEVWGVGRRLEEQLRDAGVRTVHDLASMDVPTVRQRWGVVLERTVRELQGTQCLSLDEQPATRKEIACTRSFGAPVTQLSQLLEAVTEFATRAAVKLRDQRSLANQVMVFAHTSPFRKVPRFSRSSVVPLAKPTADTRVLVAAASAGIRRIFEPGFQLSKAGVMLLDLQSDSVTQGTLELGAEDSDQSCLMSTLDAVNSKYGRGTISIASAGTAQQKKDWQMRQERRTPAYTTNWKELAIVHA